MKITYKAHIHEPTGWGRASRDLLEALIKEYDVSVEPLNFQADRSYQWVTDLEHRFDDSEADVVLHYLLPHKIRPVPNKRNIAYCLLETNDISRTIWHDKLMLMDEIWAPNTDIAKSLANVNKCFVVPHCVDDNKYSESADCRLPQTNGTYKFYTIGENITRKNLFDLISCFHIEFDPQEPVSLIIKTSEDITEQCRETKKKLDLYPSLQDYKEEIIIDKRMEDSVLMGLHKICDCFVTTSFGEAICLPLIDAAMMGNSIIGPNHGGPKDMLPIGCKFDTISRYCVGGSSFGNYQNAFDSWEVPIDYQVRRLMRSAYQNRLPIVNTEQFKQTNFLSTVRERLSNG